MERTEQIEHRDLTLPDDQSAAIRFLQNGSAPKPNGSTPMAR